MAMNSNGQGRIYLMVGIIATVMIPLAMLAPGMSRQVTDKAGQEERLDTVYNENEQAYKAATAPPAKALPVPSGSSGGSFGEAGSFGEPMMDPNAPLITDSLPQYKPAEADSPSGNSGSNGPTAPAMPKPKSQSEIARMGAEAIGLSTKPTSKTVIYRKSKPSPGTGGSVSSRPVPKID